MLSAAEYSTVLYVQYSALCCVVLRCAALCCIILCCTVPHCTVLYPTLLYSTLYSTYSTALVVLYMWCLPRVQTQKERRNCPGNLRGTFDSQQPARLRADTVQYTTVPYDIKGTRLPIPLSLHAKVPFPVLLFPLRSSPHHQSKHGAKRPCYWSWQQCLQGR